MDNNTYNYHDEMQWRKRRFFLGTGIAVAVLMILTLSILMILSLHNRNQKRRQFAEKETPGIMESPVALLDSAEKYQPVQKEPVKPAKPKISELKNRQNQSATAQIEKSKSASPPIPKKEIQEAKKISSAKKEPVVKPELVQKVKVTTPEKKEPVAKPELIQKAIVTTPEKKEPVVKPELAKKPETEAFDPCATAPNTGNPARSDQKEESAVAEKSAGSSSSPELGSDKKATQHKNEAENTAGSPEQVAMLQPSSAKEIKPVPHFTPEDMPIPQKIEMSDEAKIAIQTQEPDLLLESATYKAGSPNFKDGLKAFREKDYKTAIKHLEKVPMASTLKRGVQEREEYVKANFYRGLSLHKTGRLKEAVTAYKTVLTVEKYFPVCELNLGICYIELKQYAKAHRSMQHVIRDQNRIPPAKYDKVIQRARYFWALAWTRMYQHAKQDEKREYYRKQATLKWADYRAWFGDNNNYEKANRLAENYINSLKARQ